MIVQKIINLLILLVVFLVGIDFTISGYLVFQRKIELLERTKLLGIFLARKVPLFEESKNKNKLVLMMFSQKSLGIYAFGSGISLILIGIVILFDTLF